MIDPRTASLTPAALAMYATRKLSAQHDSKWKPALHLTHLSEKLVQVARGDITRLAIFMPPRSGKSRLLTTFSAWFLGHHPDRRVIWAANEHTLASGFGAQARDLLNDVGPQVFGLQVSDASAAKDDWQVADHNGGMLCRGIRGRLTGSGANVAIVDDPVKDPIEADSQTIAEQNADWYFSVLLGRLEPNAAVILCMQRWGPLDLWAHVVDESWETVELPALAREGDPIGRDPGEPLWPERGWTREAVEAKRLEIELKRGRRWWRAQYEGLPQGKEDSLWDDSYAQRVDATPIDSLRVRAWDLASTANAGDYCVGGRLSLTELPGGNLFFVIEDIERGQWASKDVEDRIVETARRDGYQVKIILEIEPGSSGKAYFEHLRSLLSGYEVIGIRPTGSKQLRWEPMVAAFQRGTVAMLHGTWNKAFINEMRGLPGGKHDDQADACAMAFNQLVKEHENQPMITVL